MARFFHKRLLFCIGPALLAVANLGAGDDPIRLAFVGRAVGSSEYAPVYAGVRAAVDDFSRTAGRPVELSDWTPPTVGAELQAAALRKVFVEGLDGVIVDCVDAVGLSPVIDFLAGHQIAVVTVRGDAEASARVAFSGADRDGIGRRMVDELKRAMGRRAGPVAILGGDLSTAANRSLLDAVTARLEQQKMPLYGVYPCPENAAALEVIRETMRGDRDRTIHGWLSLGPWPLESGAPMPWPKGSVQLVVADVIPVALAHVASGRVAAIVGEDYFASGYEALRLLLEAVTGTGVSPTGRTVDGVWVITADNVDGHLRRWTDWMQ